MIDGSFQELGKEEKGSVAQWLYSFSYSRHSRDLLYSAVPMVNNLVLCI